jgi:hypothetical protein
MDAHETIALVALLVTAQTGRTLAAVVARRASVRVPDDVQGAAETYTDHGPAGSGGGESTDGRVSIAPKNHDQPT